MSSATNYAGIEAELVPGVLHGYRSWRIAITPNCRLTAVHYDGKWERGVNEAVCLKGDRSVWPREKVGPYQVHLAPCRECTCGIYAAHQPWGVDPSGPIYGSVKAYGKVLLGTRGFRAQKAEIEALVVGNVRRSPQSELIQELGERYQVPIFNTWSAHTEAFPPIPVDHLIEDVRAAEAAETLRLYEEASQRLEAFYRNQPRDLAKQMENLVAMMEDALKGKGNSGTT